MQEISDQLINKVLNTRFEDLNPKVVSNVKNRIIDAIGCAIAGANACGSPMAVDLVKEWGGAKESTILVHGVKAPAHNVAMANAIMTRSHDFEPCGPYFSGRLMAGHISGTTVPTALAMVEKTGGSGKDMITALVAGDDFAVRILAASDYSFITGWDCTGTVNAFGATAIAAKLMGLTKQQMSNALGIVVNQLAGVIQIVYDANHSFKLPQGLAARAGIMSAELAQHGYLGIKDFLSSYFTQYCRTNHPENAIKDLATEFLSDCVTKPYPGCRVLGGSIDVSLDIAQHNDINVDDITEITVNIANINNLGQAWSTFMGKPFVAEEEAEPQIRAVFSLVWVVANVMVRKSLRIEHLANDALCDPKVLELSKLVKLGDEPALNANQCAGIRVRMKNGKEYTAFTDIARGDPIVHPVSKEELLDKFWNNIAFSKTITKKKAENALNMLENLEQVNNISSVINKLVQ
jgi:2-methylcitrate dehydratase PrpD